MVKKINRNFSDQIIKCIRMIFVHIRNQIREKKNLFLLCKGKTLISSNNKYQLMAVNIACGFIILQI